MSAFTQIASNFMTHVKSSAHYNFFPKILSVISKWREDPGSKAKLSYRASAMAGQHWVSTVVVAVLYDLNGKNYTRSMLWNIWKYFVRCFVI